MVNPYDLDVKNITLLDVYNEWEARSKIALNTMKGYRSAFNRCEAIHKLKIRDIKVSTLEDEMLKLKPSIQRVFKNVMNQLYTYALKNEIVDKNLSELLTPEPIEGKTRKPFTVEEVRNIKKFKHEYNDVTIVLFYTGFRINELLEMKKINVDLDERCFHGGKKSKAGKTRVTPIHDDILPIVTKWVTTSKSQNLIERVPGASLSYDVFMKNYWKRLQTYLNVSHTPHSTRHTFVTQGIKSGMNRDILKRIVGHSNGDVTNVYDHKEISELLTEINKLKY